VAADKTIKCVECGADFIFSATEQEFFMSKGFTQPKRCKACRLKKKAKNGNKGSNPHGNR